MMQPDPDLLEDLHIIEAAHTCTASLSIESLNRVIIYRSNCQRLLS